MESKIKYYYNLLVEKIVKKENFSLFVADNNLYILKKETNISPIFFIKNDFINVIKNKDGQYITNIENIEYVVLKVEKNQYNIYDRFVIEHSDTESSISTSSLWIEKNKYLEQQILNFSMNKDELIQSFDYYMGLAENAIAIMKKIENKSEAKKEYVCHRRIYYPNNTINYYDPTNYVIDYKSRDIAEYIKSWFFKEENVKVSEIESFIKKYKLNNLDLLILYARLIYPTYYFDVFEDLILSKDNAEAKQKLLNIINKTKKYQQTITDIFEIYVQDSTLPYIKWINDL